MKKNMLLAALTLLLVQGLHAQSGRVKFGLRAGLNFSSIMYDNLEKDAAGNALESQNIGVRLNAGVFVRVALANRFGILTGVHFNQRGNNYVYEGESYLKVPDNTQPRTFEGHQRLQQLNTSLSYIEVPALAYVEIIDDRLLFEFGPSVNFLITARAPGLLEYTDADYPDEPLSFSLDYRYFQDEPRQIVGSTTGQGRIDGVTLRHAGKLGAYYFNEEKDGSVYNPIDLGLNVGLSYYVTPGLRFGARAYFGLTDVTNNYYDVSLHKLDDNQNTISREDNDRNFGVQAFLSFNLN